MSDQATTRGTTAASGAPPGPSPERWIEGLRRAVAVQRDVFADRSTIAQRTAYEGVGEGGDDTLVIDRLCEEAVFAELDALHAEGHEFTAISEERGEVTFGPGASPVRVVIDPIDGSLNARRTVPLHSLSVAVASGPSMADITLGYVYEFGAGEEFTAVAGAGARLNGAPIELSTEPGLEIVALEASKPKRVVAACEVLDGRAYRIRAPGSIAVCLAYVSSGRHDGMLTTRPCRSVDAAAGRLLVSEAGGALAFGALAPGDAGLGLDARYHVAAARSAEDLGVLLEAQEAIG